MRERLGDGGEEAAAFQRWGTGKEGHVVGAKPGLVSILGYIGASGGICFFVQAVAVIQESMYETDCVIYRQRKGKNRKQ